MSRRVGPFLALSFVLASPAWGAADEGEEGEAPRPKEGMGRRAQEESEGPRDADDLRGEPSPARQAQATPDDDGAHDRALTLGLGGVVATLGGFAFPRIPLKGEPTGDFTAHGLGGALEVLYDFSLMDLDWRLGVLAALPGLVTVGGNVGIRKVMGPWENPQIITRGAGGMELLIGAGDPSFAYLIPVFVGLGESGIEYQLNRRVAVGAAFQLLFRYGLPLGVGFNVGGFLRATVGF
jgi:hypothetical protein